jgi:protein phosphatase
MQRAQVVFETGAVTHVGKVRERNEDSYLTRPEAGIWAVADGMGGHEHGDLASQTIIEALRSIERPTSAAALLAHCESQVVIANDRLRKISGERGGAILGATLAVLLTFDTHYACVWSGDSRIYLVRAGAITQLSRDHTEVEQLLSEGTITPKEAKTWTGRNVITHAIGVFDEPELEMCSGPLQPGDSFVICSDGLTNHVQDDEILNSVRANLSQRACDQLLELTLQRGAVDNVTVIVVRYNPESSSLTASGAQPPDLWEAHG